MGGVVVVTKIINADQYERIDLVAVGTLISGRPLVSDPRVH